MATEKRLINANALGRDAFHIKQFGKGIRCVVDWDDIEAAPTVDAVEVVHGQWDFTEYEYFDCSVCGESYYNGCDTSAEARKKLQNGDTYRFCPYCGAKMDGERRSDCEQA